MRRVILKYSVFLFFLAICVSAQAIVSQDFGDYNIESKVNVVGSDSQVGGDLQKDFHTGGALLYNLSFGKSVSSSLATEISFRVAHSNSETSSGGMQVRMYSLFFNGYFTRQTSGNFIPYLTSGISNGYYAGFGKVRNNMINGRSVGNSLYDFGIGTFIKITEHWLLDLNCKRTDFGASAVKYTNDYNSKSKIPSKELMLNLVYKF